MVSEAKFNGLIKFLIIITKYTILLTGLSSKATNAIHRTSGDLVVLSKCCSNYNSVIKNETCLQNIEYVNNSKINSYVTEQYLDLPNHLVLTLFKNNTDKVRFSLISGGFHCSSSEGVEVVSVPLVIKEETISGNTNANSTKLSVNFTPHGYFKHGINYYSPEEYCIKSSTKEEIQIQICKTDCKSDRPCITRCCEFGEVYDVSQSRLRCMPSGNKHWEPVVYRNPYMRLTENETKHLKFHFISNHPRNWCDPSNAVIISLKTFQSHKKSLFRLLEDGTIVSKNSRRRWHAFPSGTHCIDGIQNAPESPGTYTGDEHDTILFDCGLPKENKETSASIWYGIAEAVASVFLLLTVIVYVLLWDKQNIHGWTLLGHVISMFGLYVSLVTTYFYVSSFNETRSETSDIKPRFCIALALLTHFFFLSTFCWMTLINFDLWWTFRTLKPTAGQTKRKRRFCMYILFAVGIPAIIISVGVTLDQIYGDDIESEVIVPQYGKFKCFLDLEYAAWPYLYGPVGFLLLCNAIFFAVTVYTMYRIQQTTKFATTNSSQNRNKNQKLLLFTKLFLVMGVTWIFEIITWYYFGDNTTNSFVIVLDFINILQPLAIFVIFVCKAEILNSLRQKYPAIEHQCAQRQFGFPFLDLLSMLAIEPATARSIIRRCPKLERMITPITKSEALTTRRSASLSTDHTNVSWSSVKHNPNTHNHVNMEMDITRDKEVS